MTRAALGWAGGILVTAFLIVLAVPRTDRELALYAFLLLAGALLLAGLIAVLAAAATAQDALLVGVARTPDRRPAELEAIERDVRETLATGAVDDRLRVQIRSIALSRLAARHGVEDAGAAERMLGEGPLGALLAPPPRGALRVRLRSGELARAIDELERL